MPSGRMLDAGVSVITKPFAGAAQINKVRQIISD
jgi:hypothetical protein